MVTLRNISPLGQIDLPLLRREGEPLDELGAGCLEPGEEFVVDDTIAGHPPTAGCKVCDVDAEDTCAGAGLLAQVDNYELVPTLEGMSVPQLKKLDIIAAIEKG